MQESVIESSNNIVIMFSSFLLAWGLFIWIALCDCNVVFLIKHIALSS